MKERVIPGIFFPEVIEPAMLFRWLNRLPPLIPKVQTFEVDFNPTSIAATSESVQTITIAGVSIQDIITINKPTSTAGLGILQVWASAANQVSVKFYNHTGAPIDPGQEIYRVMAVRI